MSYIMFSTLSLFPYHDWPVFCEIPANTILYLAHPVQRKKKKVAPHDTISPRVRYHVCVGSGPSPSSCIISGGSGRIHLMIFYFIFLLDGRFVVPSPLRCLGPSTALCVGVWPFSVRGRVCRSTSWTVLLTTPISALVQVHAKGKYI